jgi:hypothetical protein
MEDAKMTYSILSYVQIPLAILALTPAAPLRAQEPAQKPAFYDVQMTKEEVFSYTNLKFKGDYTSLESPSGSLVLGKTEAGVTIVILLGAGTVTVEAPDAVQEKFKAVFGRYPLTTKFKTLYLRLHPKEYDATFGKLPLVKGGDDATLAKAKELYDLKFLASYHAGPRALIPPEKARVFEFDTEEFGQIRNDEEYWLTLRRLSPYGSVYPARFVNPKQRYALLRSPAAVRLAVE